MLTHVRPPLPPSWSAPATQIPPLVLDRVCIVVSPLIALMEDQVAALNARGVTAAFLGSAQSSRCAHCAVVLDGVTCFGGHEEKGACVCWDRRRCLVLQAVHCVRMWRFLRCLPAVSRQVKDDAWAGAYQFVYMTPELVCSSGAALASLHERRGIALVAVGCCSGYWIWPYRTGQKRLQGVGQGSGMGAWHSIFLWGGQARVGENGSVGENGRKGGGGPRAGGRGHGSKWPSPPVYAKAWHAPPLDSCPGASCPQIDEAREWRAAVAWARGVWLLSGLRLGGVGRSYICCWA